MRFATATAIDLSTVTGKVPEWIKLFPIGEIPARDGRKWRIANAAAAQAVVDRTRAWYGSADPFVDYDHQIVAATAQEPGATAPAAGWVKALEVRDDGIYARVEWTEKAAAAIAGREYRYVSPYFLYDGADNVTALVNVALVNRPALDLPALAAAQLSMETSAMDKALLAALGLSESATLQDALAAITAATASATALKAALAAAGLPETTKPDVLAAKVGDLVKAAAEKAAAASAQDPDPTKFVPRAMFDDLATQVKTMQESTATASATQAVEAAIAAGKIAPAQKDWALGYAGKDLAGFTAFASAAPKIVGASSASALPPGDKAATAAGLVPEEATVGAKLGIAPDVFAKNREGN